MSKCGCGWEFSSDLMIKYHNEKWCKIEKDEDELFAMLVLETMQAGLSWSCVINKEEAIRKTFKGLAPRKVLSMPREEIEAAYENKDIKFVGSTIIYSYLQAIGVINDHLISCSYR